MDPRSIPVHNVGDGSWQLGSKFNRIIVRSVMIVIQSLLVMIRLIMNII